MELQGRQGEFEKRAAQLVVLGSLPESQEVARQEAERRGITYALLYDANTSVTRELDLWSDHMEMPWMGYLIIGKSGRIVASELRLSESKGAAPANVDEILTALDRAQQARAAEGESEVNRWVAGKLSSWNLAVVKDGRP